MNDSYVAGFFDADGCVSVDKDGRRISLVFAQKHRKVLDAIQSYFGVGKVKGYKGKTSYFILDIAKMDDISRICDRLLPHSIVKRRRLELAKEFCVTKQYGYHKKLSKEIRDKRSYIYDEVRKLNQR